MSKDTIYRQDAIDAICNACGKIDCDKMDKCEKLQLPPANCSEIPNNSDTISRQAAKDALHMHLMYRMGTDSNKKRLDDWINGVPSAQPEIIHCRDCKHHWTHSCMDAFPREICDLDQTFYDSNIDYCSLAERRTDAVD